MVATAGTELNELARQFRAAREHRSTMIWLGFLVFPPVWVLAYIDHEKMQAILRRVAALGMDAEAWQKTI